MQILGPFHPVLVHLPIGILLFALLLEWMNRRYNSFHSAIRTAYLVGFLFGILACITGLSLASEGDYVESILSKHQWLGITTTIVAGFAWVAAILSIKSSIRITTSILLLLLITITGHFGGTLTHGEGYLFNSVQKNDSVVFEKKIIPDVQQAVAYTDIIQPMLEQKCYGCHNANKQKGGLRLDGKVWMIKGGKHGPVLTAGKPTESELYSRVVSDMLDDHHMPPKSKPQLKEKEINILHWWIQTGSSFEKKVNEIEQTASITTALKSLESKPGEEVIPPQNLLPGKEVEKAPVAAITALQKLGIAILPVAANTNYLQINFISVPKVADSVIALIKPLQKQLVSIKLAGATLSENSLRIIAGCEELRRLSIEHSNITDAGLALLKPLKELQYLNLVGTPVTSKGLLELKGLTNLQQVYIAQTKVTGSDWMGSFPKTKFDTGGYKVPSLAVDTIIVKKK